MKIINKSDYILLTPAKAKTAAEFIQSVSDQITQSPEENYVIELLGLSNVSKDHIKDLANIKNSILADKHSFVVLIDQLKIDELPEEINTVPSIKEAEDVIQMEMIERDLGF